VIRDTPFHGFLNGERFYYFTSFPFTSFLAVVIPLCSVAVFDRMSAVAGGIRRMLIARLEVTIYYLNPYERSKRHTKTTYMHTPAQMPLTDVVIEYPYFD